MNEAILNVGCLISHLLGQKTLLTQPHIPQPCSATNLLSLQFCSEVKTGAGVTLTCAEDEGEKVQKV